MTRLHCSPMTARNPRIVIACLALGMSAWAACRPTESPRIARFECPEGSVRIPIVVPTAHGDSLAQVIDQIPLSGPVAKIPEYHDCQRFIEGNQYTSLYAIFAAFRLDNVDTVSARGHVTPMATIYTPDGAYPALGIKPGFNCLFLEWSGHQWTAKMIPWGMNSNNCADGHIPPSSGVGTDLSVRPQTFLKFLPDDYPEATRWDRDSHDSVYTIGIRCGAAWCDVGPHGFTPSAGYNGPPLTFDAIGGVVPSTRAQERVQRVKGWYDVQRLAETGEGGIHPTTFRGFLIPHPALDSLAWWNWRANPNDPLESYYRLGWIHVGYAFMEGDYSKWNFRKGLNKVYMCYGALGDDCKFPTPLPHGEHPSTRPDLANCPKDPIDPNPSHRWWARTTSQDGATTYVCIQRMDHRSDLQAWATVNTNVQYSIPATARWHFMPQDESGWWGCPTGCCTKQ